MKNLVKSIGYYATAVLNIVSQEMMTKPMKFRNEELRILNEQGELARSDYKSNLNGWKMDHTFREQTEWMLK